MNTDWILVRLGLTLCAVVACVIGVMDYTRAEIVPPGDEQWTVIETLPLVAVDDAQGVWLERSLSRIRGRDTVEYTYAYRTDRGAIRHDTTASLEPAPIDVLDDAEPGDSRLELETCAAKPAEPKSTRSRRCAIPKRITIHVPASTVDLGTAIDGPNG